MNVARPTTPLKFADVEPQPPPSPAPAPSPPPAIQIGELLVWKGWWWTLTEIAPGGKILFILKGPTVNLALKTKLGMDQSRRTKKKLKRTRIKAQLGATGFPGRGAR